MDPLLFTGIFALIGGIYWFYYQEKYINYSAKKNNDKHLNLIALKKELDVIKDDLHPVSKKSKEKCHKDPKFRHWFDPKISISKFDTANLLLLLNKGESNLLPSSTVLKFSELLLALTTFQHLQAELRNFAFSDRELLRTVSDKLAKEKEGERVFFTKAETIYMDKIFDYNYQLHMGIVSDINNKNGLYTKYSLAHRALVKEVNCSLQYSLPLSYALASAFAWLWTLGGIYILSLYFGN